MKKYISAFVAGFGAGVLQVVPIAKSFACCLIIPAAAFIALSLDQKASKNYEPISFSKAATFGLLTGLWAALFGTVFDIFITLITKNNDIIAAFGQIQSMLGNFPVSEGLKQEVSTMLNLVVEQIKSTGFSFLYTFSVLINNLVVDVIFGFVGGVIGMQILNARNRRNVE